MYSKLATNFYPLGTKGQEQQPRFATEAAIHILRCGHALAAVAADTLDIVYVKPCVQARRVGLWCTHYAGHCHCM